MLLQKNVWIPILILLLVVMGIGLFYRQKVATQAPVTIIKPVEIEKPKKEVPIGDTSQGGHWHGDEWHADPHTPPPAQRAETAPPKNEDLTPIPWQEAKQRLLKRKAAAANKPQVPRAATWEGRRQQVAADPDLIWQLNFVVPASPPEDYYPLGNLYDYDLTYGVDIPKYSESQRARFKPLQSDRRNNDDPEEDKRLLREIVAIKVEGLDTLTAAKYIKSALSKKDEIAVEYAERAVRENPTAETYHVLGWVHWGLDDEASESALRRSLSIDRNYLPALRDLAGLIWEKHPAEAIGYLQRAADLDTRIPKNNYLIGQCYERLGRYEKALEVYQASPFLHQFYRINVTGIQAGVPEVLPLGAE